MLRSIDKQSGESVESVVTHFGFDWIRTERTRSQWHCSRWTELEFASK